MATTMTTKVTERIEHEAVRAARERLARARREAEEVRAKLSLTPRSRIHIAAPLHDRADALVAEERDAAESLRRLWREHEAPGIVEEPSGRVTARLREYIATVRARDRAWALLVEERATLNEKFQRARAGVPSESDWSNYAPPNAPIDPGVAGDKDDWERRALREWECWQEMWGA